MVKKCSAAVKVLLYLLYSWCLMLLDCFILKKSNLWLIASHTGIIGNARFFAEHVLENHEDITVYFYAFDRGAGLKLTENLFQEKYKERFRLYKVRSTGALFAALKAGCVFISHDLIRDVGFPLTTLGNRRIVVNLWHGMAVKKHWLAKKYPVFTTHRFRARQFNKVTASSASDAVGKAAIFNKSLDDIWITGNPRNDLFVASRCRLPADLRCQEEALHRELNGRKLILYAPTWRSYQVNFLPFDEQCLDCLCRILDNHNAVLGLRLHEKDEQKFGRLYQRDFAYLDINREKYPETQLVLKNTSLLITDYSSIWLDYLLTGNPVIAFWYDLDQYCKKRGTLWDLIELFPGIKVYSQSELILAIEKSLQSNNEIAPEDREKYRFVKSLFNKYSDGKNSERIINYLNQETV